MTSADTLGVTIIAEWHGRQHALLLFLLCWVLGSLVVADAMNMIRLRRTGLDPNAR